MVKRFGNDRGKVEMRIEKCVCYNLFFLWGYSYDGIFRHLKFGSVGDEGELAKETSGIIKVISRQFMPNILLSLGDKHKVQKAIILPVNNVTSFSTCSG